MNPTEHPNDRTLDDDQLLEMLVDGELDEAQRRELLLRLDREPDGWRRCALSFLEVQSLREAMPALAGRPTPNGQRTMSPVGRRPWSGGRGGTLLAMAASFLLALGLGTLLRDFAAHRGSSPSDGNPLVATQQQDRPGPSRSEERRALQPDRSSQSWQLVNLGVSGGPDGAERSIQLPACQRDTLDEQWLNSFPQAVPRDVRRALQRTGHRVDESRQFLPLRLRDGRRLIVPVDQVDVHYVGNQPYQ